MVYTCTYQSALENILLAADENGLTGLWFEGQKYFANTLPDETVSQEIPILTEAKSWLDMYFAGEEPNFTPTLHPAGSPFRQAVWKILLEADFLVNAGESNYAKDVIENACVNIFRTETGIHLLKSMYL